MTTDQLENHADFEGVSDALEGEGSASYLLTDGGLDDHGNNQSGRLRSAAGKAGSAVKGGLDSVANNKYTAGAGAVLGTAATYSLTENGIRAATRDLPNNFDRFTGSGGDVAYHMGEAAMHSGEVVYNMGNMGINLGEVAAPVALGGATVYVAKEALTGNSEE